MLFPFDVLLRCKPTASCPMEVGHEQTKSDAMDADWLGASHWQQHFADRSDSFALTKSHRRNSIASPKGKGRDGPR